MTPEPGAEAGPRITAVRWWAAAIIPAMIVLPFYIFPLTLWRPLGVFDGRRVIEIVWAAGLVLALAAPPLRAAAGAVWLRLPTAQRAALLVFLAGALASSILASAPVYALRGWAFMVILLVITLPLGVLLGPVRGRVLEVLGLTLLFYGIVTFMEPSVHGFSNPRLQGQALAVTVPALLFSGRIPLALLAAPALAVGAANGSRALILTMAVVTVVAVAFWPERKRRVASGAAGLALAAVLLWILGNMGQDTTLARPIGESLETSSWLSRLSLWQDALGRFLGAPLLGVGPGMLARTPGVGWEGAAHPHNAVLLAAAETGAIGLGALLVFAALAFRPFLALGAERRGWALALVAGGVSSMLDGTNIMPASQALLVLAAAMVLPTASGDGGSGKPRGRRTGVALLAVGAVTLLLVLATLGLPSAEPIAHQWRPRFYQNGLTP